MEDAGPNVVVVVRGGIVQEVVSDSALTVTIVDFDCEGTIVGDEEAAMEQFEVHPEAERVRRFLQAFEEA